MSDNAKYEEIDVVKAHEMLENNKDFVVIDVRRDDQYWGETGHIKGAVQIPLGTMPENLDKLQQYKDKNILLCCFIGNSSTIGRRSRLYPQVTVRENVRIGDRVIIHSNSVIGSDGFGYETVQGKHLKIPQIGSVEIGDDVEIGSCVCIDRGRFGPTRVGRGTKIDNLVQIAHNVVIGEDCLVISQVGISGSTEVGDRAVVAGQAGLVGHITIGADAVIGARSGVSKSVPPGTVVLGEPARPIQEQKKLFAQRDRTSLNLSRRTPNRVCSLHVLQRVLRYRNDAFRVCRA